MILVTGATGFLGGHLVRRLSRNGREVIASGRNVEKLVAMDVRTFAASLDESSLLEHAETLGDVTTIVHCAALSSPWGSDEIFHRGNVLATKNLLALAKTIGVRRFVHISTPSVYFRFEDQLAVAEDATLPSPVNAYARTKAEAERLVLAQPSVGPIILRPRGIYGYGDNALLPRLLDRVSKGPLPLFRDGQARTDITHVDDVVAVIECAIDAPAVLSGETFNVSGGEALRLTEIIQQAANRNDLVPRWRKLPVKPVLHLARLMERFYAELPGRPEPPITCYGLGLLAYSQTLDITKAERLLDWTPEISFEEGLRRTFPQSIS